jgi:hypothetical protein
MKEKIENTLYEDPLPVHDHRGFQTFPSSYYVLPLRPGMSVVLERGRVASVTEVR